MYNIWILYYKFHFFFFFGDIFPIGRAFDESILHQNVINSFNPIFYIYKALAYAYINSYFAAVFQEKSRFQEHFLQYQIWSSQRRMWTR